MPRAERASTGDLYRRRADGLAGLDAAIDRMAAELAGLEDGDLHHLMKRAVLLRSELRHLDFDRRSVDFAMAEIERRLATLHDRLEERRRR